MDFSTLVDLDDYFDGSDVADAVTDAFADEGGDIFGFVGEDLPLPEMPEMEALKEPEYEPIPEAEKVEEVIKSAEPPSQDLLNRAGRAGAEGGESGIKKFFDELSEKEKNSMLRYAMGAMGMGASQALRAVQQRREQEFQREQSDVAYQRRREEEDRAREARRVAGTPQAMQFNIAPRGIIGGGMGG